MRLKFTFSLILDFCLRQISTNFTWLFSFFG